MTFDLPAVTACVLELAASLIPGWCVTVELAPSVDDNGGALAMVYCTPERQLAHVVVAPHPPGEDIRESVAHELTHAVLSPLTTLVEWSPAAVMLEEQIVERLGKLLAKAPAGLARAVTRALHRPRTDSVTVRKRISALATRRRFTGRKREVNIKLFLAALKAALTAEDPKAGIEALIQEVEALPDAGGDGGGDSVPPMREQEPEKASDATMREDQVPEQMRAQYRAMKRTAAMSLDSTIRLRIHELRTVDGLSITPAIEARLRKAMSPEDFEERLELVKASIVSATETPRKRSGVTTSESNGNGAPSIASLIEEGMSEQLARSIHSAYGIDKETGEIALVNARKRLPKKGGA